MSALTRRETDILLCLTDALVIADRPFVPIHETKVAELLDANLGAGPPVVRYVFRGLAYVIETIPLLTSYRRRFRRLERDQRIELLAELASGRMATATKPVRAYIAMIYYSDEAVMATQGFDKESLRRRGNELRQKEGRW